MYGANRNHDHNGEHNGGRPARRDKAPCHKCPGKSAYKFDPSTYSLIQVIQFWSKYFRKNRKWYSQLLYWMNHDDCHKLFYVPIMFPSCSYISRSTLCFSHCTATSFDYLTSNTYRFAFFLSGQCLGFFLTRPNVFVFFDRKQSRRLFVEIRDQVALVKITSRFVARRLT